MFAEPSTTHSLLYILRHGQSAANVAWDRAECDGLEVITQSNRDADVPLSQLGVRQAETAAAWFGSRPSDERPNLILSSPFVRTHQTATIIANALGIDEQAIEVDERLREKEFGIFDRFTRKGIETQYKALAERRSLVGKFYFRPPCGESWCDVILRLRSVVDSIRLRGADYRILVVAHKVIIHCFRYLLEGLREADILAIDREGDFPNGGYALYRVTPGFPVTFNLTHACCVPPSLPDDAIAFDECASTGTR